MPRRRKGEGPPGKVALLQNQFIPLSGELKALWLASRYREAIARVKAEAISITLAEEIAKYRRKFPKRRKAPDITATVQSIRLVWPAAKGSNKLRIQQEAIGVSGDRWDIYARHALSPKAHQYIIGFMVRVRILRPMEEVQTTLFPEKITTPRRRDSKGRFKSKKRKAKGKSQHATLRPTRSNMAGRPKRSLRSGTKKTGRNSSGPRKKIRKKRKRK